jgi:hypothetical protein
MSSPRRTHAGGGKNPAISLKLREVFILAVIQELSYKDIAPSWTVAAR